MTGTRERRPDDAVAIDVVAGAIFEIRDCPVPLLREGLTSPSVPARTLNVELLGRIEALKPELVVIIATSAASGASSPATQLSDASSRRSAS